MEAWESMLGQLVGYEGSQADFCLEHGIGVSSLRYHLSRQKVADDRGVQTPGNGFVELGRIAGQESSGGGWVELTVGKICLKVWADTDPGALRAALRAAVEICGPI
jgi:hypothetical protein